MGELFEWCEMNDYVNSFFVISSHIGFNVCVSARMADNDIDLYADDIDQDFAQVSVLLRFIQLSVTYSILLKESKMLSKC